STIPCNSSGKIDKKKLPQPEIKIENEYVASVSTTEKLLENIWSDTLNLKITSIGTNRSFFELGGHSLKAIVLINKIAKEFNVSFPLEKIFENPTIKQQAEFIDINEWLSKDNTTELEREMIKEVII
ncbi:phosphopantetheine-binding protein, partial [Aquimarina mytili]